MQLIEVFNDNYIMFLEILQKSFPNNIKLRKEITVVRSLIHDDPSNKHIHKKFKMSAPQKNIDRIYDKDESVFDELFTEICLGDIFKRLFESERKVLWKNLENLCRYSSMIRACGTQLGAMEDIANEFMEKNQNVDPKKYHMKLFKEMLSGGEMSQKLLSTFNETDSINDIMANVGNIMKNTHSDKKNNFSDIFNEKFTEDEIKNVSKELKEFNSED